MLSMRIDFQDDIRILKAVENKIGHDRRTQFLWFGKILEILKESNSNLFLSLRARVTPGTTRARPPTPSPTQSSFMS